jgi:hypothetical protein
MSIDKPTIISEEAIHRKLGKNERQDIKAIARESAEFVRRGNDPRDLPRHLRLENM